MHSRLPNLQTMFWNYGGCQINEWRQLFRIEERNVNWRAYNNVACFQTNESIDPGRKCGHALHVYEIGLDRFVFIRWSEIRCFLQHFVFHIVVGAITAEIYWAEQISQGFQVFWWILWKCVGLWWVKFDCRIESWTAFCWGKEKAQETEN